MESLSRQKREIYGGGPGSNPLCLHFARSLSFCHESYCGRQQMNGITAFVDASNVYGSDTTRSDLLRTGQDGRMREGDFHLLPLIEVDPDLEKQPLAGDVR